MWCRDEWNPAWITEGAWTRAELLTIMTEHVRTVVSRYRGRAASWDVVNEAFTAAGGREPCVWERYIGPDWIEQAFRAAAAADPDALLFYNEWSADVPNARFGAMEAMAKDFAARGVPLHGIGMQHHTYGFQPLQDRIEEAMARVAALGLAVHVSEMDVPTSSIPGTTEQKLAQQEQAYASVAAGCEAQPACMRFTTWGFVDGIGWRPASELSAPFDANYQAKPAWRAIQRALRPPAAPPSNRPPGTPGRPAPSATLATRNLTVSWPAASDADGQALTYTLEHRDADDAAWTTVATGIRGTSFSFDGGRLERQGTLTYRVRADDGFAAGAWSAASVAAKVDRSAPYAPTPTASRAPEWTSGDQPWFRDSVTVQFRDGGDQALPDGSPGAGVDPASVPGDVSYATAGTHSVTGTVRDLAGNVSASRTRAFAVDTAAPAVTAGADAGGVAYEGGWTRSDVKVTWTCADAGAARDRARAHARGRGRRLVRRSRGRAVRGGR